MKKKFIILLTLITILFIYYGEERNFYCLSEGKCVTVWKTYGNTCYIIPYKYYGLFKPSGNYMITTNTNDIDIIWENNSDNIILTSDEESKIINSKAKQIIIDYNSNKQHYDSLFTVSDGKYLKYKKDVNFISIYIKENYAKDKNGNKL